MSNDVNQNPANEPEKKVLPADFIPMSAATQKLQVPERPGYHRYWFRGTPERLAQALRAYYRFVDEADVDLNNFDLAGDANKSGNTDMGTRVSRVTGDELDHSGQPNRLYLMECPNEYFEASQALLNERNEAVATALRGGQIGAQQSDAGETPFDASQRYVKGRVPDLFNPHKRRI